MLYVEASKADHNLISKWVIGCPIGAKLILKLPAPYYFLEDGWEPEENTFSSSTGHSVIEPTHIRYSSNVNKLSQSPAEQVCFFFRKRLPLMF